MKVYFITHPEVRIDPVILVPDWGLSEVGRERMTAFCDRRDLPEFARVFSSDERKARECAEIFGRRRRLGFTVESRLGENDRSATGYVAPPRFWEIVDDFFARPHESVLGWERAIDAQARISTAVRDCVSACQGDGHVCIFSHGGVGTLLLCELVGEPIARSRGQPIAGGGCYFAFDAAAGALIHGWRDIAA